MNETKKPTWFAVLGEIVSVEISDDEFSYGKVNGRLFKVDINNNGKMYSVQGKYSAAIESFAQEEADKIGGILVPVYSEQKFIIDDIDMSIIDETIAA